MGITDKELLAICNLSNLRMEFADVASERDEWGNILSNHTIYSLLDAEYNAIKKNSIEERVFLKEENEEKKKIKIAVYDDFKKLRKTAPIVLEYYDRYRESEKRAGHEGEFLDNWEIIYSADLYQIIIDYSYEFYKIFHENITKEDFIKLRKIPSREKIAQNKTTIEVINVIEEIFLLGDYKNIKLEKLKAILERKGEFETITQSNILEEIIQDNLLGKLNQATFLIKAILRSSDFKVLILKHKKNKDFVIAINDFSSSDEIAESLRDGKIVYDLHILNSFFLSKINTKDKDIKIKYTGYGVGAQVALYMNSLNRFDNRVSGKIFTGNEKYTFKEIVDFNLENSGIVLKNFEIVYYGFSDVTAEILELLIETIKDSIKMLVLMKIINILYPNISLGIFAGLLEITTLGGFIAETFPPALILVVLTLAGVLIYNNSKVEGIYNNLQEFKIISKEGDYTLISSDFINAISIFDSSIKNKKYYPITIENKNFFLPKELAILLCIRKYRLSKALNEIVIIGGFVANQNTRYIIQFDNNNKFKTVYKKVSEIEIKPNVTYNVGSELQLKDNKEFQERTSKLYKKNNNVENSSEIITSTKQLIRQDTKIIMRESREKIIEKASSKRDKKRIVKIDDISTEVNISNLLTEIGYLQQSIDFNTFSLKKIEIVYMDDFPKITSKIDEVKYNKAPSFVYFPFINKNGILVKEIRDEYIGSILRSTYQLKSCKYDTLEHIGDGNTKNKVHIHKMENYRSFSTLREYSYKMNLQYRNTILMTGLRIILKEHIVAVKEKLLTNSKFLEEFYVIREEKNSKNRGYVLLGILNKEKNDYAKDKIGFIYNSKDRLYGCVLEEKIYFTEQSLLEEVDTTSVCNGATLICSVGSMQSFLKVTSQSFEEIDGKFLATEEDRKENINIAPFGRCNLSGDMDNSCIKHWSLGRWEKISSGQEINRKKIIISTSIIKCKIGGTITIKNPNCKSKAN